MPNLQGRAYAGEEVGLIINVASRERGLDIHEIHSLFEAVRIVDDIDLEYPLTAVTAIPISTRGFYRVRSSRLRDRNEWIRIYNGIYGSNRSTLSFRWQLVDVRYLGTVCELRLPNRLFLRREVFRRVIRPGVDDDAPLDGIVFAHYYYAQRSLCHDLFLRIYPLYPLLL